MFGNRRPVLVLTWALLLAAVDSPAEVVNIRSLGADPTGKTDIAPLVRIAQAKGDVYFPTGTYLMSAVDVRSNRRYFGDGAGRTIIKKNNQARRKKVFILSTYDYDGSGHSEGDLENVTIERMTFDFNLWGGWVSGNPHISFKGRNGKKIRKIVLQDLEFIDSARVVHPELARGDGRADDAWCIEVSSFGAPSEDITIRRCINRAESHQFVAGGGTGVRNYQILDNTVYSGSANSISVTTISSKGVARFEDIVIKGNRIYDYAAKGVFIGFDPRPTRVAAQPHVFRKISIIDNEFHLGNLKVYGKALRTRGQYPRAIVLLGTEPGWEDVRIAGNKFTRVRDYRGNSSFDLMIQNELMRRKRTRTASRFSQPPIGGTKRVRVSGWKHADGTRFPKGGIVGIEGGGFYQVRRQRAGSLWLSSVTNTASASAGTVVEKGAWITPLGGCHSDITIANNRNVSRLSVRTPVRNLTVTANLDCALELLTPFSNGVEIRQNERFSFLSEGGDFSGTISHNILREPGLSRRPIELRLGSSRWTGLPVTVRGTIGENRLEPGGRSAPEDTIRVVGPDSSFEGLEVQGR